MPDAAASRHQNCSFCSELADADSAMQTMGREEENTYLPGAAYRLREVCTIHKPGFPYLYLKQCPECETYYLYRTYYEFIVGGSEDEEYLARLTDDLAADYREGRRWEPLDCMKTVYER